MKLSELSPQVIERIKSYRWDRIIEKHEGPEKWELTLKYHVPEFMEINGHRVLLPLEQNHHPNITILRCIESSDGQTLTIFLKDTTFVDRIEHEWFEAGFVAVCDKIEGGDFHIAVLYHEWFIIENK